MITSPARRSPAYAADEQAVDEAAAQRRVRRRGDDQQQVGVRDERLRAAAQALEALEGRAARVDAVDARAAVRLEQDVDVVADDGPLHQSARELRDALVAVDPHGGQPAAEGDHDALRRATALTRRF